MTSKLKKAGDANEWLARRVLEARVTWHRAKAAHEKAVAEAEASPGDQLAQRREVAAFQKALEAESDWERVDALIHDMANPAAEGTPE